MEQVKNGNEGYNCPICGKWFADVDSFAKHFEFCNARRVKENREAEEKKKQEQKEARLDEVHAAYEKANALRDAYIKDYGYYYSQSGTSLAEFLDRFLR